MMEEPIYLKIISELKEKISLGVLKPNELLPSEAALCESYGVSRLTARKALETLEHEGLIYFVQGKGNFVRGINGTLYELRFNEVKFENVLVDRVEVKDVDVIESTKELVFLLKIHPKTRVLRLRRVLYSSGVAIGVDSKYVPYYPGFPLVEDELETRDFVQLLSDRTSPYSVNIDLKITARLLGAFESQLLKMEEGACGLWVEQLLSDPELGIIGYSETCYNPIYAKIKAVWER